MCHKHTIYFDITQRCNVGCAFCMYAKKRNGKQLALNSTARENIAQLFSRNDIKRISISGEGEPLNNLHTLYEILALSSGKQNFEIITSGAFQHSFLRDFYEEIQNIVSLGKDFCNIRLSADSYHIAKIPFIPHGMSMDYFIKEKPKNLTLSFRSIDSDHLFSEDFLMEQLKEYKHTGNIVEVDPVTDRLIVSNLFFDIVFKNMVHPGSLQTDSYSTLYEYIDKLEKKYERPFTLGSMNKLPCEVGLDITIKPDGEVVFYGIEPFKIGNILKEKISLDKIRDIMYADPVIHCLYTQPFKDIIKKLSIDSEAVKIINKANNPYWVIKDLSETYTWDNIREILA